MRDLKHLIYFESLLENDDNDLVKQAQAEGKLALGYTCYHMPEPLLNLGNCFSVRLRAPRTGSLDIATYYMSNYTCEYARALVERGMEGGYQFLDALAGVDACSMMNRAMEHFEILQMIDKPNFFVSHCDIPYKVTDYTLDSYVRQMRRRVLEPLAEKYGVDTSDAAIRKAVAEHNEVCAIISEIAPYLGIATDGEDRSQTTVTVPNLISTEWSNAQVQLNIKGLKHHLAESESDQTAALVTYQ